MISHHSLSGVSTARLHAINITNSTFLSPNSSRKISKMIDSKRNIRGKPFSDRLTIVKCLCECKHFRIFFNPICDFEKNVRPDGRTTLTPIWCCRVRSVQCGINISSIRTGDFTYDPPSRWRDILKIISVFWLCPFATNKIFIARLRHQLCAFVTWVHKTLCSVHCILHYLVIYTLLQEIVSTVATLCQSFALEINLIRCERLR